MNDDTNSPDTIDDLIEQGVQRSNNRRSVFGGNVKRESLTQTSRSVITTSNLLQATTERRKSLDSSSSSHDNTDEEQDSFAQRSPDVISRRERGQMINDEIKEELKKHKRGSKENLEELMKNKIFQGLLEDLNGKLDKNQFIDLDSPGRRRNSEVHRSNPGNITEQALNFSEKRESINRKELTSVLKEPPTDTPQKSLVLPTTSKQTSQTKAIETHNESKATLSASNGQTDKSIKEESQKAIADAQSSMDPADILPKRVRKPNDPSRLKLAFNFKGRGMFGSEITGSELKSPLRTRRETQDPSDSSGNLLIVPINTSSAPSIPAHPIQKSYKNLLRARERKYDRYYKSLSNECLRNTVTSSSEKRSRKTSATSYVYDPLRSFEDEEKQVAAYIPSSENLNFLAATGNNRREKYELDLIESKPLQPLSGYFYLNVPEKGIINTSLGQPRAIELDSEGTIYIGTSKGIIFVYDTEFESVEKLGRATNQIEEAISALRLFRNQILLLSGYESGKIVVWDLRRRIPLKQVMFGTSPITAFDAYKLEPISFLVANSHGRVSQFIIKKEFLGDYNAEEMLLLNRSAGAVADVKTILIQDLYDKASGISIDGFLAAIVTISGVAVVCFNPHPKIVHTFNIGHEGESNFPYICWGGVTYKGEEQLCLVIACGSVVELFNFQIAEEITWKASKHIIMEAAAASVDFVKPNLFCIIDVDNMLHLIDFRDFQEGPFIGLLREEDELYSLGGKRAKVETNHYKDQVNGKIFTPSHLRNSLSQEIPHYHRSIYFCSFSSTFYQICDGKLNVIKLYDTFEFLDAMLLKKRYRMFLIIAIELIHGNIYEVYPGERVASLPHKDPKLYLYIKEKLLACNYHYLFQSNKDNSSNEDVLNQCPKTVLKVARLLIDFCIEIELIEYLFTVLKKSFELIGLNDSFIEALEPFILINKIYFIPEPQIYDIIDHLQKANKRMTLQRLFLNFNLKECNLSSMIASCLKNNLPLALGYICTRGENDYVTPLVELLDQIDKYSQTTQIEEIQNACNQVLWYTRKCLQRRRIYSNLPIEKDTWKALLVDVYRLVFKKERIELFIRYSPQQFVPVCLLIFSKTLKDIFSQIPENVENFDGSSGSSSQTQEQLSALTGVYMRVSSYLLRDTAEEALRGYKLKAAKCFFVAVLAELEFDFLSQILALECIMEILNDHTLLTQEYILFYHKGQLLSQHDDYAPEPIINVELEVDDEFYIARRDDLAVALCKFSKDAILKNESKFAALQNFAQLSQFPSVRSYVSYLQGDLKRSIEIFTFKSVPNCIKMKIFDWLEFLLSRLKERDNGKYELIEALVLEKISEIVSIHTKSAKQLIEKHFSVHKIKIVNSLQDNPELQLKYLGEKLENESTISLKEDNPEEIQLYIKLLCNSRRKNQKKKLLNKLQVFEQFYKLDEILSLCKSGNIKDAQAFLEERSGNIPTAVRLGIEFFEERVLEYIQESKPLTDKRRQKLDKIISRIDLTLEKSTDELDTDKGWNFLMTDIAKVAANINASNEENNPIIKEYKGYTVDVCNGVLANAFAKLDYNTIIETAEHSKGALHMGNLRYPMQTHMENTSFHRFIYRDAIYEFMELSYNMLERVRHDAKKAEHIEKESRLIERKGKKLIGHMHQSELTEEQECELVVRTLLVEQEKSDHVQFNKDTTSVFTEKAEHIDMGCESHQFQATAFRRKLLLRAFDKGCVENIDEVLRITSKFAPY